MEADRKDMARHNLSELCCQANWVKVLTQKEWEHFMRDDGKRHR